MSNGSIPNANDVEWIQRKVSEAFFDEASRAATGTSEGVHSPDSDGRRDSDAACSPGTLSQTTPEQNRSENSFIADQIRSHKPAHSPGSESTSIPPQKRSTFSHETLPQQQQEQQQSTHLSFATRPSRAAAGTAASRIISQYTTYGHGNSIHGPTKQPEPKPNQLEPVYERRHCSACDCMISVNNWQVHLDTRKHRENTRGHGASKQTSYRSACTRSIAAAQWTNHQDGQEHRNNISGRTATVAAKQTSLRHCVACDCHILVKNWHIHTASQKHRNNTGIIEQEREDSSQEEDNEYAATAIVDVEQAPARSAFPPIEAFDAVIETKALQPQKKVHLNPHLESVAASIATLQRNTFRSYQGRIKRNNVDKDARLDLLSKSFLLQHVDFATGELEMLGKATVRDRNGRVDVSQSMARAYAGKDFDTQERDWVAIKSSVQRLEDNQQNDSPKFYVIESHIKDPTARPARCIASLLRHRELGSSAVGRNMVTRDELKSRLSEDIKPWRSFKGASHDVVTVAWAPNSMHFAAGAAAHSNTEDLQYNRPCNLLFGDLRRNTLTELPDHCVDRQRLDEGPNSSQDLFNACDPKVYKTITDIKFHAAANRMYTSSEDRTVKVWDLTSPNSPRCSRTLKHDSNVTGLDISPVYRGLLATASQRVKNAIQVFEDGGSEKPLAIFSSTRATARPEWQIYPESISWGPSAASGNLLLAGFNAYGKENEISREGHLCLWDGVTGQDLKPTPASQAIHTAAWHPVQPYFVTGGACGFEKTDRWTTKTAVRVWDHRYVKRLAIEYECPAPEMTDVSLHPSDQNIAVVGCTDSISYVWDFRWPNQPLHQLRHGKSIMPVGERDTGVMMSLWGTSLYYSGSSDGEIRAWDVRRHPNDVLVRTVAQLGAGVQSGAFSPDGTHLLVGDAAAAVHVLSSTPWAPAPDYDQSTNNNVTRGAPMTIIRANTDKGGNDDNPGTDGIETARKLLLSGQITIDPRYGPGKGPCYTGPFAKDHREPSTTDEVGPLKEDVYQQQPFSGSGQERPEFAAPVRNLVTIRKERLDKTDEPKDSRMDSDQIVKPGEFDTDYVLENGLIEEEWWSRLGEDEIARACTQSGQRRG